MPDTYTFGDLRAAVHAGDLSDLRTRVPEHGDLHAVRAYLQSVGRETLVSGAASVCVMVEDSSFSPGFFGALGNHIGALRFDVCGVPLAHASRDMAFESVARWLADLYHDFIEAEHDDWLAGRSSIAPLDPDAWREWPGRRDDNVSLNDPTPVWHFFWGVWAFTRAVMDMDGPGAVFAEDILGDLVEAAEGHKGWIDAVDVERDLTSATFMRAPLLEEAHDV